MLVPFADWRPDVAILNGTFTADLNNVLCADGFYRPFPALQPVAASPVPGTITGGFSAKSTSGEIAVFVGTTNKLWRFDGAALTWTDVSKPATTYQSSTVERWQFEQYGDRVIAVNANDAPQSYIIGASSTFVDLPGSPPFARRVAVWGDFLVLGGLLDNPRRVIWSGLDDPTFWTIGSNNCDFQDFPDGGPVMGMTSANNPLILQESAIRRAVFVPGSDAVFTFDKLHDKRGTKARYSLAFRGDYVFFLAEDGFYQIDYSGAIQPIGFQKVDGYLNGTAVPGSLEDVISAIDPVNSRVYWAFRASGSDVFDTLLIYDWVLGRWSKADVNVRLVLGASTPGYTLEQLDTVSSSLDALPFSLDSRVWAGGNPVLSAFDSRNRLSFFAGDAQEATITTQEFGDTAGGVARLSELMPVIDTNLVHVSIGKRMRRQDPVVWSEEAQPSKNTGIVRKRSRSRWQRFRLRVDAGADWTEAQGMNINNSGAGIR